MMTNNPYAWWELALTGEKIGGPKLPVNEGNPMVGFYRKRKFKGGPWQAVAIFEDGGKIVGMVDDTMVDPSDIWTFVCRNPVSYDDYNQFRAGNGWPDDDKTVSAQIDAAGIGDNSGAVDEAETLKDQIDAALKGAEAYAKIEDDATSSKALSLRNRLNELSKQADNIRVKEKEPHLEAGKAVDAKFQPLVKKAKAGADTVRDAIGAWETVKLQAERKRQADLAAEQARIASQAVADAQNDVSGSEGPETPTASSAGAPTSIKPTYGKAASVSVKLCVKDVTDWAALYAYMSNREEVQTLLRQLAQKALDAGRTNIPGITTEEKASVK